MTAAARSTRHRQPDPCRRARRRRRRLARRLTHWRVVLWLAGATSTTVWMAAQPETGWTHALTAAAAYLVLLGVALTPLPRGDEPAMTNTTVADRSRRVRL